MKYNYVYFDTGATRKGQVDKDNYFYICTQELRQLSNVSVVSYPLDYTGEFLHKLYVLHNHPLISRKFNVPGKRLWYPYIFKNEFKEDKPFCFICSGYYVTPGYIKYLKEKYPNSKFVLIHRDLIHLYHERNPLFTRELVNELFDLEMSYDLGDVEKYKLVHFDEFESKIEITSVTENNYCDVFFAGAAKDRLPLLIEIYDYLSARGIRVCYYITGTTTESRIERKNIIYSNRNMSYREMLNCSINSKCLLEVQQGGAVGYTSRFLEAVMYNKKLITNNLSVMNSKFYDKEGINVFSKIEDISIDFIKSDVYEFNYQGEFSPVTLIEKIDSLL